jgi:type I restriction enzyme S subunit
MKLIDVIQKTETINPQKTPNDSFEYIDVSSICNKRFLIQETSTILGKDAPSRARKLVRTGDILFATVRPTLQRIAQVPNILDRQVCSTGYFVLRPKDFVERRFLFYFLFTEHFMGVMEQLQKGASYPAVNDGEVSSQTIFIPPLTEQKRIVAILDEAFEGIDRAIANTEKNLTNAREIFESYLSAIFTQKSDGWEEKKLGDICENLDSQRIPITKSKRKSGNMPYYGASGVVDYVADFIFDENLLLVSEDGANLLARTYPIAFSISGKTWVNNHAHVLRFREMSLQKFVEYYLNSISLESYVSGMAQPKLNQKALNSISLPLAPKADRERIIENLNVLTEETQRLKTIYRQKIAALKELKQSILQKAFTGKLTAATVEKAA